ncbi:MAG: sulfotransferase family 2 domain-containing protein [Aquisalimonadaceae bacterium]
MIICHRHRFIFIKTRKTAGSSVEIGLSRVCGPDDVVTTLSEKSGDEELRAREGGTGPSNWQKSIVEHRGWREWRKLLFRFERAQRFAPHTPVSELRQMVTPDVFSGYYKFTLERNPWDHAVSRYFWQKHRWERGGRTDFPDISEYLKYLEREKPHWLSNWGHYTISDEIAVDRVVLYESLSQGLEEIRQELGIDGNIALPEQRAKGGYRKEGKHYSELLGPADRERVARVCAREIDAFGYVF